MCAGFVQRFTIGFRGPLCLVSGFSGVTLSDFAIGASIGACITMSIQLTLVRYCNCEHGMLQPELSTADIIFPGRAEFCVMPILTRWKPCCRSVVCR